MTNSKKDVKDSNISGVKEAIVRESTRLFLMNGYRGTSVKEITESAEIGRGTVYWYFKSKDEILVSIFEKFDHEFLDGLIEAVRSCKGDFTTRYKAYHKFTTEFARDNRELSLAFNTLLNEIVGTNTEAERVVKAIYTKHLHFIEEMLEDGKRDGSVRSEVDSGVFAHVIIASHAGMLVQWFVCGETLDARAFVKAFRDLILKGITGK
jgi:AcrR family transcriptional regulator